MGKRQRGFLFWKLLTLSWSWHLIQIFRLEVLWRSDDPGWCLSLTRRSQLVVPDWGCHCLSVRRERRELRYVLCSSIVEVAGLGPVTEAGASQTRSVKGLTENKERSVQVCLLEMSHYTSHLCRLSGGRRWRGLWAGMRNEARTHSFDPTDRARTESQREIYCLRPSTVHCENTKRYQPKFFSIRAIFMSSYYLPHPVGGGNGWKCQNYESEGCNIKLTSSPPTPPANLEN